MKTKISLFLLLFGISLVTLNYFLWQWDQQEESTIAPIDQRSPLVTDTEKVDANFAVEKLNNQVSVKQLRKALFKDSDFDVLSEAKNVTDSELTADIERLSQEITELNDSL